MRQEMMEIVLFIVFGIGGFGFAYGGTQALFHAINFDQPSETHMTQTQAPHAEGEQAHE
jgi:hypothetical protein